MGSRYVSSRANFPDRGASLHDSPIADQDLAEVKWTQPLRQTTGRCKSGSHLSWNHYRPLLRVPPLIR